MLEGPTFRLLEAACGGAQPGAAQGGRRGVLLAQLEAGADEASLEVGAARGALLVGYTCVGGGVDGGGELGAEGGAGARAARPAAVRRELAVALPAAWRLRGAAAGGGVRAVLVPGGRLVVLAALE